MFAGDSILSTPCLLTLGSGARPDASGAHETATAVDCAAAYPFIADLSGWEEIDAHAIRLRGAKGAVLGEFQQGEGRSFRGEVAGAPYALTPIAVRENPS